MATALTAIHGAGVIHRDLKPRNVLLPPGSPKVIDFGIAHALQPARRLTAENQLAGTGHEPFHAPTPMATAARILSEEPPARRPARRPARPRRPRPPRSRRRTGSVS